MPSTEIADQAWQNLLRFLGGDVSYYDTSVFPVQKKCHKIIPCLILGNGKTYEEIGVVTGLEAGTVSEYVTEMRPAIGCQHAYRWQPLTRTGVMVAGKYISAILRIHSLKSGLSAEKATQLKALNAFCREPKWKNALAMIQQSGADPALTQDQLIVAACILCSLPNTAARAKTRRGRDRQHGFQKIRPELEARGSFQHAKFLREYIAAMR